MSSSSKVSRFISFKQDHVFINWNTLENFKLERIVLRALKFIQYLRANFNGNCNFSFKHFELIVIESNKNELRYDRHNFSSETATLIIHILNI